MIVVACSGFPIAVSRYLASFHAVELADTELALPGIGTIRRWQRESPEGFVFTILAPAEVGQSGFSSGKAVVQALEGVLKLAATLDAKALVVRVPEDVAFGRTMPSKAKKLLGGLPKGSPPLVIDAPGWTAAQVGKVCDAIGAAAACDPLTEGAPSTDAAMVYYRFPGPAGHRSRYDEESVEQIAELAKASEAETTFVVFRNIDMEANARSLTDRLAE